MKVSYLLKAMFLVIVMVSCSNSSKKNLEEDVVVEDYFPPTIVAYGALDSMAYDIPESEYIPQYKDWDTIVCSIFRNFKWNVDNKDSIILLQYVPSELGEDWITHTCKLHCVKGEKKEMFDYFPHGLTDEALQDSIMDNITGPFYMEITKRLVTPMVASSLKKVYHVIEGKNSSYFKDSVGEVCMSVRLYPKK